MNQPNPNNTMSFDKFFETELSQKPDYKYSFGDNSENDDNENAENQDEQESQTTENPQDPENPQNPSTQHDGHNGDTIHSDVYSSKPDYTSSHLLTDNSYFNKVKTLEALQEYDTIITHSWDGNSYGPVSAWYDAFELWFMVQYNSLPSDLGGPKIALVYPDCPSKKDIIRILDAIFDKYQIDFKMFRYLCHNLYFIDQPKELKFELGEVPYDKNYENYVPKNVVFVDGKLPANAFVQVDNLFLSITGQLREEELILTKYNFLMIYTDKRIEALNEKYKAYNLNKDIRIARSNYSNTLIFNDIRRIDFSIFKKTPSMINMERANELEIEKEKFKFDTSDHPDQPFNPKKRFLMYLTPKNRTPKWLRNDTETIRELDDILNALPDSALNKIGLQIRNNQKELYQDFTSFNKRTKPKNEAKKFDEDQLEALRNKGTIEGNGYTVGDVISEEPKAHIILAGLNEKEIQQVEFESLLLARALTRGINISIEVYYQKDLPIINIHSKYDYYIFTPAYKWTTSRFIPEAYWYNKKVIITKKALKSMNWNFPLNIRYNDAKMFLSFLAEDDVFKKPKSTLAKNLLGIW